MKLGVVLPVLDEAPGIVRRLQALAPLREQGARVVVVDGGSTDETPVHARPWADAVLSAPRGRAAQMNAGACAAAVLGCDTLLFLHADTALPPNAHGLIQAALARGARWGRFDVRIEGRHPMLPLVARLMNVRSRLSGVATGDQALFVQRRLFESLGGFAPIPLMEDVELSDRLRRRDAPACLAPPVITAGRRWDTHGFWRTVVLMWRLRAAYALGAAPSDLAQRYGYRARLGASVVVMAKAPVAGLAKTRLIPLLGPAGAARAQRAFALQTVATVRHASLGPLEVWCAPDTDHRFFRALSKRHGVPCRPQPTGDLGHRMAAAMESHFRVRPNARLIIVGTDCPALSAAHLQRAADALQHNDAVLIPAEDGGYVLIGFSRPLPEVFQGVDWSTARVLSQTHERLRSIGATWLDLPALWDVDEPADWERFQAAQAALAEHVPHTASQSAKTGSASTGPTGVPPFIA